jgi:hypothetical protein
MAWPPFRVFCHLAVSYVFTSSVPPVFLQWIVGLEASKLKDAGQEICQFSPGCSVVVLLDGIWGTIASDGRTCCYDLRVKQGSCCAHSSCLWGKRGAVSAYLHLPGHHQSKRSLAELIFNFAIWNTARLFFSCTRHKNPFKLQRGNDRILFIWSITKHSKLWGWSVLIHMVDPSWSSFITTVIIVSRPHDFPSKQRNTIAYFRTSGNM